jgi:hypothetical protein
MINNKFFGKATKLIVKNDSTPKQLEILHRMHPSAEIITEKEQKLQRLKQQYEQFYCSPFPLKFEELLDETIL